MSVAFADEWPQPTSRDEGIRMEGEAALPMTEFHPTQALGGAEPGDPSRKRARREEVALRFRAFPGVDNDPTVDSSTGDQLAWIRGRIAGRPFTIWCAAFPGEAAG